MIKISGLNKYFNKGKSNEVHAINNTTLEFGDTGLVCILGESGSGKTTLMNTIGGLDSFQKGSISIGDVSLDRYSPVRMEEVRNSKFGYVFQQKFLLQEHTVSYNIELALNNFEISQEEKEARIDYVLQAVGMKKFKKRLVSQLSGGQQQRIAIARALVKTPEIIFADEPTGNLDENNTMRIMSILKKVSMSCLVVLVTHEKRIAEFFADRIIHIQDGKVIKDIPNVCSSVYEYSDNTNLYLKEFKKELEETSGASINFYHRGDKEKVTLNLVYHNDKFYIQAPDENKVVFLSSQTEMQMIDDYKPSVDLEQVEDFDYSLTKLEAGKKSALSFQQIYKIARENMRMLGKRQAFMIVSFLITAVLMVIATADYLTTTSIHKENFITSDSHYINVSAKMNKQHEWDNYARSYSKIYKTFLKSNIADDLYVDLQKALSITSNNVAQFQDINYSFTGCSYVTLDHFNKKDLIYGRMPKNRNEIIVDKWLINQFYKSDSILKILMPNVKSFLNLPAICDQSGTELKIVGICNSDEPTVYIDKYYGISVCLREQSIGSLQQLNAAFPGKYDDISLGNNEVLVSKSVYKSLDDWNTDIYIDPVTNDYMYKSLNNHDYKIVGTFPNGFGVDAVINDQYYNDFLNNVIMKLKKFNIYTEEKNMQKILNYFHKNKGGFDKTYVGLNVKNTYQDELNAYEKQRSGYLNARFVVTVTIVAISMLMLFFTMKSNAIRRMQEIAVYRIMGIAKGSILATFVVEIFMITSYTILPVVLILSFLIKLVTSISYLNLNITYTWPAAIFVLVFLYLANIAVCVLSVYRYIKMPPAQMAGKF